MLFDISNGDHYTVLIDYGKRADGLFNCVEHAFNWAVHLIKERPEIDCLNMSDEEIYQKHNECCRVIALDI